MEGEESLGLLDRVRALIRSHFCPWSHVGEFDVFTVYRDSLVVFDTASDRIADCELLAARDAVRSVVGGAYIGHETVTDSMRWCNRDSQPL